MTVLSSSAQPADPPILITTGNLEIRLAETAEEVRAAQKLRWQVFYEEMAARPSPEVADKQIDFDAFDDICDHLIVMDTNIDRVVGTYRLIRRSVASRHGGHYSASEYDIRPVLEYPGEILEVGRSCVDAGYRTRGTMQLLWQGIAAYVFRYNISLLFGCASLPGTDPARLALPLSYLHYHHLAPPALKVRALPDRYVDMRRMDPGQIDPRLGFNSLPPLIKGYLRVGGFVGEGAVVDRDFNTTDVFIVVKRETISDRYLKHYERRSGDADQV
jgi:putative hemolysin